MHFNHQEQVAVLLLTGSLLVGTAVAVIDARDPGRLEDFHVLVDAVPAPPVPVETPAALAPQVVAINHASAAQLEGLPHIGPQTAAAIVAHRAANGPFETLEDLTAVRGIGPITVERLRPLLTTD